MMGKEQKFRNENALLKQVFVKDPEKTIESLLKKADAVVEKFVRFSI
jgi:translation elongation factor EF-Ts